MFIFFILLALPVILIVAFFAPIVLPVGLSVGFGVFSIFMAFASCNTCIKKLRKLKKKLFHEEFRPTEVKVYRGVAKVNY